MAPIYICFRAMETFLPGMFVALVLVPLLLGLHQWSLQHAQGPSRRFMIIEKNYQKSEGKNLKMFSTLLLTVLLFRCKEVMTRKHTFLLKCRKFYTSFCRQRYDKTTQACQTFTTLKIEEKKHLTVNLFNNLSSVDDIVIS